jgi:hypothetical protein
LLLAGLVLAGWWFSSYISSYQKLAVEPDGVTAAIYPLDSKGAKLSKPAKETNTAKTFRLKKGDYVIESAANSEFRGTSQKVSLKDRAQSVRVAPDYSEQKIRSILAEQQSAIKNTITKTYSNFDQFFTIGKQELYDRGKYYGAKLFPLDPSQYDRRGIILQKEGTGWKIITLPPAISISGPLYPSVPRNVISAVNDLN